MNDVNDETPLPPETQVAIGERVPTWLARRGDQSHDDWLGMLRAHQHRCWYLGQRVLAEEYLSRLPELRAHAETTLDLICSEVMLRAELGESPGLEEYLRRFPAHTAALCSHFHLRQALAGDPSATRSYDASYPPADLQVTREATEAPAAPAPRAPLVVPGYEILGELGRGGMGIVYKARQARPRRLVALKVIRDEPASTERMAHFYGEAEMVARLRHPNIVQLYEVGEHAGRAYFSLEYHDGGSLKERLGGRPLEAVEGAELVAELAAALHHIHQRGVIHRDLKPANVLLTSDGSPRLIDFGLAVYRDQLAEPAPVATMPGTPHYMAPEQAQGCAAHIGPHTDIFGLGLVLYEVLTGAPPYRGKSLAAIWKQACRGTVVPPRRVNGRVPRSLERICLRALAPDPLCRYGSALELEQALREYLHWKRLTALRYGAGVGLAGLLLSAALALALWGR